MLRTALHWRSWLTGTRSIEVFIFRVYRPFQSGAVLVHPPGWEHTAAYPVSPGLWSWEQRMINWSHPLCSPDSQAFCEEYSDVLNWQTLQVEAAYAAILASSLLPPSQADTGRGAHTHTPHLHFPHLSALPGSWKCPDRFHAHTPSLLGCLGVHSESLA